MEARSRQGLNVRVTVGVKRERQFSVESNPGRMVTQTSWAT